LDIGSRRGSNVFRLWHILADRNRDASSACAGDADEAAQSAAAAEEEAGEVRREQSLPDKSLRRYMA